MLLYRSTVRRKLGVPTENNAKKGQLLFLHEAPNTPDSTVRRSPTAAVSTQVQSVFENYPLSLADVNAGCAQCSFVAPRIKQNVGQQSCQTLNTGPCSNIFVAGGFAGKDWMFTYINYRFINRQGHQVKYLFSDGTPPIVLIVPYSGIEFSARAQKHLQYQKLVGLIASERRERYTSTPRERFCGNAK